jgi:hypothetical protein
MNKRDKELWNEAAKDTKGDSWDAQVAFMQRFADLIRADEREACAIMADECVNIEELGAAIRARGNT